MTAQIKGSDLLNWIADRLISKHGEAPDADFIVSLREMATDMDATEPTEPVETRHSKA